MTTTPLGQTGADTITHIVSMVCLAAIGLGFPIILAETNAIPSNVDTATHAAVIVAICGVETAVVIEMGYYSTQYQKSPTGQITFTTLAPDGTGQSKATTVSALKITGPDGTPIVIPPGSTIQTS